MYKDPLHKTYEMVNKLCFYREGFRLRAIVKVLYADCGTRYTSTTFEVMAVVKHTEDHHHLELVGAKYIVSELNGPEWNQEWHIKLLDAELLDEAIKEVDPQSKYEWSRLVIKDHTKNPFTDH